MKNLLQSHINRLALGRSVLLLLLLLLVLFNWHIFPEITPHHFKKDPLVQDLLPGCLLFSGLMFHDFSMTKKK